ncbi:hypothetical protein N7520_005334 [Penicillium odoratum]|uniref:uncharacterized protein n=1 Tax=Penicillium odoratum TaxID=1167516 RepID=UPI0025468CC2|nr:uncharacterized protein N7520_005334 [Penicillium odoratum]KAJ5765775.1 hypothetical protein N7520_005334 [Penicillium odoratum]
MTKIFLTGVTGYIAGDALATLFAKHPNFSFSALVRTTGKAEQVKAQYPNIRIVLGDLGNSAPLERESAAADIVLHASDHAGAAKAIAAGLVAGHTKENPGYWLHTGGTGILTFAATAVEAGAHVRNAVDRSMRQSLWNNVHIHDLSDVYSLLVDAAIAGRTDDGLWGAGAYYLTENMEHVWGELAQQTVDSATRLGYLPEVKAEPIDLDSAKRYAGFESLSWGMNSRGRARRARKILGWNPSRPSLVAELPAIVQSEWQALQ